MKHIRSSNGTSEKQGLASMLAIDPNAPPETKDEMLLRTKVFYFNRVTGKHVTIDQVRKHTLPSTESLSEFEDERILTFTELQELIQSGKFDQIPNNKVVPDKLNESPPSKSKTVARKKPWELTSVELP